MSFVRRFILIAAIVAVVVAADLASKAVAESDLKGEPQKVYAGGLLRLTWAENPGAFLSLGAGQSHAMRFWIFVVCVGGVLVALAWFALVDRDMTGPDIVCVALMLAGGIGNLYDRLTLGVVRDFMIVGVGFVRTGVFNVADMAVTGGAIAMLLRFVLARRRVAASKPPAEARP